jgi:hypothetical protein
MVNSVCTQANKIFPLEADKEHVIRATKLPGWSDTKHYIINCYALVDTLYHVRWSSGVTVERKTGATALKPHARQSKRHGAIVCVPLPRTPVLDFFCRRLTL